MGAAERAVIFLERTLPALRAFGVNHAKLRLTRFTACSGFFDDVAGHVANLFHESPPLERALLNLLKSVFPFAREFRQTENADTQAAEQGNQRDSFAAGNKLSPRARDVFLND